MIFGHLVTLSPFWSTPSCSGLSRFGANGVWERSFRSWCQGSWYLGLYCRGTRVLGGFSIGVHVESQEYFCQGLYETVPQDFPEVPATTHRWRRCKSSRRTTRLGRRELVAVLGPKDHINMTISSSESLNYPSTALGCPKIQLLLRS